MWLSGARYYFYNKEGKITSSKQRRQLEGVFYRGLPTFSGGKKGRGGHLASFFLHFCFCPLLPVPPHFPLVWLCQISFCSEWERILYSSELRIGNNFPSSILISQFIPPALLPAGCLTFLTQEEGALSLSPGYLITVAGKAAPLPLANQPRVRRHRAQLNRD